MTGETLNQQLARLEADPALAPHFKAIKGSDWPALTPLDAAEPAPEFPVESFPNTLAEYVRAEATAKQAPLALPAFVALATIAAAVTKKFHVLMPDGWRVPLNVYLAPVLGSGESKSPIFSPVTQPLRDYERKLVENSRPAIADKQSKLAALKARQTAVQRKSANEDDPTKRDQLMAEAAEIGRTIAETPEPAAPLLIADSATPEVLEIILSQQGGKLAILSAEATIYDNLGGRYSKDAAPNCDVLLNACDGDAIRVHRVGRPPVFVDQPAVTVCACLQPSALRSLMDNPVFRGRGLLNRLAFAVPDSLLGRRQTDPPPDPVPFSVQYAYYQLVTGLCEVVATDASIQLDDGAHQLFIQATTENEKALREGGELGGPLAGWGSKNPRRVATMAGILHLAKHHESPNPAGNRIEKQTMLRAIAIGDFLKAHARIAFGVGGQLPALERARKVVAWIQAKQLEKFTERELHLARRYLVDDDVKAWPEVTGLLEELGYIRTEAPPTSGPRGGRPSSPEFAVNPAVLEGGAR
jgi:hypothetical protein